MLTRDRVTELVDMAGADYSWPVVGVHRLSSDARAGLRAWLGEVQNGVCAFCDEPLNEGWDICHIVSGGPQRKGWAEGNLAAGCRECNLLDARNGMVVAYETIIRRDLIPATWPAIVDLTDMGRQIKCEQELAKAAKAAKRGM